MKKKAAISIDFLIGAIIVILVGGIIALFLSGPLKSTATVSTKEKACAFSVEARDREWGILKKFDITSFSLNCETLYYCFKTAGGSCPKVQKGYIETYTISTEDDLKKNVAEIMRTCWRELGEGKKEFISDDFCGICSILFFDEKLKMNIDMKRYLEETVMPGQNPNKWKYAEYFTFTEETKRTPIYDAKNINTDKPYFVLFSGMGNTFNLNLSSSNEGCKSLETLVI